MSKYRHHNSQQGVKKVSFLDFWLAVAAELGSHRFDINPQAQRLKDLFNDSHVHAEHIKDVVRSSLPHKDGNLEQTIDLNQLLDTLGQAAYTLRENCADDLFDIELLEEIGWVIATFYHSLIDYPSNSGPGNCAADVSNTLDSNEGKSVQRKIAGKDRANVYSISRYKTKLANRRL